MLIQLFYKPLGFSEKSNRKTQNQNGCYLKCVFKLNLEKDLLHEI